MGWYKKLLIWGIGLCLGLLLKLEGVKSEEEKVDVSKSFTRSAACSRLHNLAQLEDHIFSQYGEDGVLLGLLDALGLENSSKYYVEFGVENGVQCNTRILREALGFKGLSMDGGNANSRIDLFEEFVLESNILDLFRKYQVPANLDVLSIDVDMFDFWILSRLFQDGTYRPRIIIVETNPTLCVGSIISEYRQANSVPLTVTHPDLTTQTVWDGTRYSGANPKAFQVLAERYGYDMVHCERCGVNCFLVRRDVFPEECTNDFSGTLPMIPYPCFSTMTPSGGSMIGHPVDSLLRPALRLDRNSNSNSKSYEGEGEGEGSGGSLLDTIVKHGNSFHGREHVSEAEHRYACSDAYPYIGDTWWNTLASWEATKTAATDGTYYKTFLHGQTAFHHGNYAMAVDKFASLLINTENHKGNGGEAVFGKCFSHHTSEMSCVAISGCYYNLAISLVNLAAANNTITAAASTNVKKEKDLLLQATGVLDMGAAFIRNSVGTSRHSVLQMRSMAKLLSFIVEHFSPKTIMKGINIKSDSVISSESDSDSDSDSDSESSNRDEHNNTLHTKCAHLTFEIRYTDTEVLSSSSSSSSFLDGADPDLDEKVTERTETLSLYVCACDAIELVLENISRAFCTQHNLRNCVSVYERILEKVNTLLFEGMTYDLFSGEKEREIGKGVSSEEQEEKIRNDEWMAIRSKTKGWTPLPLPLSRLSLLQPSNIKLQCLQQ